MPKEQFEREVEKCGTQIRCRGTATSSSAITQEGRVLLTKDKTLPDAALLSGIVSS
jgi:hypothetical protein